ncbi:hypothetical protein [Geobacter sp. SVR]|uniref:hypothetical protein n=1 Tax=Geobacter sp. SVR TaxID=2495594 RepID=UPI00143EF777|nr:hypothetical protein [Geobacter sp. SVR]BCS53753.1 hypothetical protein GSVR_20610 [Geobacter sp. SVR]GCF85738.1 hypothetical protein GSbR_23380 [Geobacter sp. SVR]
MTDQKNPIIEFEHDDFEFASMEEELQVDERCQSLLYSFYQYLQASGMAPEAASELAFSADYYLRDYLLDFARQNVMRPKPGIVRLFAATWFVTHTLDPEMKVLERHLEAIRQFYRFLHGQHFISVEELAGIEHEAAQLDYYRQRIESFLAIHGDGYFAWEAECPLQADFLKQDVQNHG